jgi:hypothetical protein
MNQHERSGDGSDDHHSQGRLWACPFYVSNPIRHAACMAYKLGRVPDVRQHIERKHADEAGKGEIEKMKNKKDRGTTNVERWYDLWTLFFPGEARPAMPYYTGTEFADLSVAFVSLFIGEWEKNGMPGDVKAALAAYVAFVKSTSLEMKSGRMSIQAIADVNEHRPQGAEIQDNNIQGSNTYQSFPLLPNPLGPMIMGQPQQADPQAFFPGYYDTQTPNAPTQAQDLSMHVSNSQHWYRTADPTAYSAVSAQLPPVQSLYAVAADGVVDHTINSTNVSSTMDWASGGGFEEQGADHGQYDFGYDN